jgi:hypothetical protein
MPETETTKLLSPEDVATAQESITKLLDGLGTAILGQRELLERVVICLLA